LGARSLKAGHTRFFVGYKKHSMRLWLRAYQPGVLLIPLVSWAAPAHVPEGYLLKASVQQCHRRLGFRPDIVVGDLGYIHQATKRELRQQWKVAVVTKLKADMNIVEPFDAWNELSCLQGQPLQWVGYDPAEQTHGFIPQGEDPLCHWCWEADRCPKEFWYRADLSETLLGLLPLNTTAAQRLLRQVRSWIEPTQSFEKNQLGLTQIFLNSLRLAWTVPLLADSVALLRSRALMQSEGPNLQPLLHLLPRQIELGL
jgi:hypothetical protein